MAKRRVVCGLATLPGVLLLTLTCSSGSAGSSSGHAIGATPTPGGAASTGATTFSNFAAFPVPSGQDRAVPGIVPAAPSIVQDRMPGAAGDLMMLVWGGSAWALYVSPDEGASWHYVLGPPAAGTHTGGLAQDSVSYNLHALTNSDADNNLYYSRLELTRDGAGHVSDWTWGAREVFVAVAPPDPSGGDATDVKFQIVEALDSDGARVLVMAYLYCPQPPSGVRHFSRVAARKTTAAAGVAPTTSADFVALDGRPGQTIVSDLAGDSDRTSSTHVHDLVVTLAQHPVDRSLHVFRGPMEGTLGSQLRRWQFGATAASTFTLASEAEGTLVIPDGSYAGPSLGGSFVTQDSIWITTFQPERGMRFDRLDAAGAYRADVLGNPDTTRGPGGGPPTYAYVSLALNHEQDQAWAVWVSGAAMTETWANRCVWSGSRWIWDPMSVERNRVSTVDMGGFGASAYYRHGLAVAERSVVGESGELHVIRSAEP